MIAIGLGLLAGLITLAVLYKWRAHQDMRSLLVIFGVMVFIYPGFALIEGDVAGAVIHGAIALLFLGVLWAGLRLGILIIGLGFIAHGIFDIIHPHSAPLTVAPGWYPAFCIAYDFTLAALLFYFFYSRKFAQ